MIFIGKRNISDGLFKMNIMIMVIEDENNNKNNVSSSYLVDYYDTCHDKLGHVNYDSIQRLINLELLPTSF
jgi:hypothetical protein